MRDENCLILSEHALDHLRSDRRLFGIILDDVANKNVRVQGDHRPEAPRRIAFSMSWSDTCRFDFSMPRSERKSTVSGSTVTPPSLPMLKLSRSPGSTPRWSRISLGIVIWPLDVNVAVGMSLPIASVLTLFLTPSRQRRRSLRARVERVRGARVRAACPPAAGEAHLDTVIRG